MLQNDNRSVTTSPKRNETDEVWQTYLRVFRERLRDFGGIEGQNIKFEYRFAGENVERRNGPNWLRSLSTIIRRF